MKITPKNWTTFQHYKNRKPAWIKLHRALLDDYRYWSLPDASKALAPMLWLLASEYDDGCIDADIEELAFRMHTDIDSIQESLKPLIDSGLFEIASDMLAERKHIAILEREKEREVETETEKEKENIIVLSEQSSDPKARKGNSRKRKIEYPVEFQNFWEAYPTDPLQSKKQAYFEWQRLSSDDRILAARAAPGFRRYCADNPDYRPVHACRFLSQRRFEGFAEANERGPPPELTGEARAKWVRDQMEMERAQNTAAANGG